MEMITIWVCNIAYLAAIALQLAAAILLVGNSDVKRKKLFGNIVKSTQHLLSTKKVR